MKLIGIDPSTRNIGLAFADYCPVSKILAPYYITTVRTSDYKDNKINEKVLYRFQDAAKAIDLELAKNLRLDGTQKIKIFTELPHGSKDNNSAISLAFSCCISGYTNLNIRDINPVSAKEVKIAATGRRDAEKKDMIEAMFTAYPNLNWNLRNGYPMMKDEHQADALATLLAGLKRYEVSND